MVLEVPRVLTAVVHLVSTGRPEAVHAAVMSPAEVAAGRSPWAGSQHQVFRYLVPFGCHYEISLHWLSQLHPRQRARERLLLRVAFIMLH